MTGDLNLNQLKAFYYAAQCRSITLAADKLFITQPAVSMQIKALEDQYGTKLFVRRKKKLELTDTGRSLYQIAKRIFGLVDQAEQMLARSKEVLRVGSTKTLVRHRLTEYISRFQQSYPRIQIQIHEGSSEEMVRCVLTNEVDLAIVGRVSYEDERLEVIPFTQDDVVLLVAPKHPLAHSEAVSISELAGENLILREPGSGVRRLVDKVFEKASVVTPAFIEVGNVDFIKELVAAGRGITLLASMGVDRDVSSGRVKIMPLKEDPLLLDIDIVLNKERPLSTADEAFLSILREETRRRAAEAGSGWKKVKGGLELPRPAKASAVQHRNRTDTGSKQETTYRRESAP